MRYVVNVDFEVDANNPIAAEDLILDLLLDKDTIYEVKEVKEAD